MIHKLDNKSDNIGDLIPLGTIYSFKANKQIHVSILLSTIYRYSIKRMHLLI